MIRLYIKNSLLNKKKRQGMADNPLPLNVFLITNLLLCFLFLPS